MTLGFSTKINGKATYFVEKIWQSFEFGEGVSIEDIEYEYYWQDGLIFNRLGDDIHGDIQSLTPKIHTIRADPKNRWKVGNKIHFVIGNRTKNRFQFAPILKVIAIQSFKIEWKQAIDKTNRWPKITIDNKEVFGPEIVQLVQNDGFDTYSDFCNYFKEDFEGKLIHWTDFKY